MKNIITNLQKNKKTLIIIIGSIILISLVTTFGYFVINTNNERRMSADLQTGTMSLIFSDGNPGINATLDFGETITKKFTIENTGTLDGSLSIDWDKFTNTYLPGSLSYNLTYQESEDGEEIEILPTANMPTSKEELKQLLVGEVSVPAGKKYYYNLNITLNNTEYDQTADLNAIFVTKFDVGQPVKYKYYTLSIDPNGGTWNDFVNIQTYELMNNETKEIENPTRFGYDFKGWELIGTSSKIESTTFTMGIANTTLKAKWEGNKHNITIIVDGEETTREVKYGETIELTAPSKEGYTFGGWIATNGTIEGNYFTLNTDEDVTITAVLEANKYKYKVEHRLQNIGGHGYETIETEIDEASYGTVISPEVKTYQGFTSPDKISKTIEIDTENPTKNVITYNYLRNEYHLSIDPAGGNYQGNTDKTMYYEETTTIDTPTREGHTFTGWEVTGGELTDNTFKMGNSDANLVAKWVANDYDYIVYHKKMNTDGSTYTTSASEVGQAKFNANVSPDVKNYAGFTSPPKGNLTIKVETSTPPTLNVLNYNYSRNKYDLTINPQGGLYEGSSANTVESMYYETSKILKTPVRDGYTFNGWTNLGGTLTGNTFTLSENRNSGVTANWTVNKYKYTTNHYQMNTDGSTYTLIKSEENTVDYGTEVTPGVESYTGFTSPATKSLIVGSNEETNKIDYYYGRKQFTLTINPNGGTYNGNTTLTKYYGENVTIGIPTKTGYNYSWQKTGEGNLSGNTYTIGNGNATLTANWTPVTFTVTFNANGGTPVTQSQTVTYDSKYIMPNNPTYTNYEFLGWFTESSGGTQITANTDVKITANQTLYAHWKKNGPAEKTLAKLGKTSKSGTPNFAESATTNETADGLYSMEDDYGTSYYYRGAVTDNYVKFVGYYWRIIRINGDGSIRIIFDGKGAYANGTNFTDRVAIQNIAWNTTYNNDAKYAGLMYGGSNGTASTSKSQAQSNETSTNIKSQLESWYKTNISDRNYDSYVSDNIFCNDRSTASTPQTWWVNESTTPGYGNNNTAFGGFQRFSSYNDNFNENNPSPKLTCTNKNDAFTKSDTEKGNGKLDEKIGLITVDEINLAGSGKGGGINKNYYLYKGSYYWSASPNNFNIGKLSIYGINPNGGFIGFYVNQANVDGLSYGVVPVINLSAETVLGMQGTGTQSDPFKIPSDNLTPPTCFAKDTLVYTPNGYKKIQDLKQGDKVYSYNEKEEKVEEDIILNTMIHTTNKVLEIEFDNNTEKMHITPNHPVYNPKTKTWMPIGEFEVGDILMDSEGNLLKISSIKENTNQTTVYNFEVKNNHNYYVTQSNILVHNKASNN